MNYFVCFLLVPDYAVETFTAQNFQNDEVSITLPNPNIVQSIKECLANRNSWAHPRHITIISMCPLPE